MALMMQKGVKEGDRDLAHRSAGPAHSKQRESDDGAVGKSELYSEAHIASRGPCAEG